METSQSGLDDTQWLTRDSLSQHPTIPSPTISTPPLTLSHSIQHSPRPGGKQTLARVAVSALALILAISLYLVWQQPSVSSTAPAIQPHVLTTSSAITRETALSTTIQVYVAGAVKHPGVYTLAAHARIYQLLQAADGPLPKANLVAVNLAAPLSDGQEVYVPLIGEVAPINQGSTPTVGNNSITTASPVNINTASADELRQRLHISATVAHTIVTYRLQHGLFTSVEQLTQVISKSTYAKIKDMVTVS